MNKSMQTEGNNFFLKILKRSETVSKQALQAARNKISYTAFQELFNHTVDTGLCDEDTKQFLGYRLLSIDGTTIMLPNSDELKNEFGSTTPVKNDAYARVSMVFDIENKFIVDASIAPYATGERELAINNINTLKTRKTGKYLMLLDRGYWKRELFADLIENGNKFLIRVASNVSKDLTNNTDDEGIFSISANGKSYSLRFFRFALSTGEIETLVTNLTQEEISNGALPELYIKRWGIETKYNELKNYLIIENFTGKSVLAVKQDFYATVLLSNLVAFASQETEAEIKEKQLGKNLKYEYKANKNSVISILRDDMIAAVVTPSRRKQKEHWDYILNTITQCPIPIRPERSYPRKDNTYKHISRKKKWL